MALTLTTHRQAHTYSGQVLVSYIFSNSRPPKGIAGYVDWIMDGQISDLIINNKVTGRFCESLLLVTGTKIHAHFLLIIGAGSPKSLKLGMLKEIGCYTVRVLDGLRISHFGLYPHDLFLPHLTLTETLDDLFTGVRECAQEDKQITILSNDHRQEDNIISWLKDKTYILKPKV